jgi:hypothetical protein
MWSCSCNVNACEKCTGNYISSKAFKNANDSEMESN